MATAAVKGFLLSSSGIAAGSGIGFHINSLDKEEEYIDTNYYDSFTEDKNIAISLKLNNKGIPKGSWANDREFLNQGESIYFEPTIKLGSFYSHLLISPNGNQELWEANFKRLKEDNLTQDDYQLLDTKKEITSGYDISNTNSLNNFCKEVYELKLEGIATRDSGSIFKNDPEFKKFIHFFNYCSFLGQESKNLTKNINFFFPDRSLESTFQLFPTEDNNKIFWTIKQDWFNKILRDEEVWFEDDIRQYTDKHPDILIDNAISVRKLCTYIAKEPLFSTQQIDLTKQSETNIKAFTAFKYCSMFNGDLPYYSLFNKDGGFIQEQDSEYLDLQHIHPNISGPFQPQVNHKLEQ